MHQEDELDHGTREGQPMQTTDRADLSQILVELKTRFGANFDENDAFCILRIEEYLKRHEGLRESLREKKPDEAMQIFGHVVREILQSIFETDYQLSLRMKDDQDFASSFAQRLFERFQQRVKRGEEMTRNE